MRTAATGSRSTWPDHAVQNERLQVTLKADSNTGLAADYVFCFGNLAADAIGSGLVDFASLLALAQQYGTSAPVSAEHLNRDGQVDFADLRAGGNSTGKAFLSLRCHPQPTRPRPGPHCVIPCRTLLMAPRVRTVRRSQNLVGLDVQPLLLEWAWAGMSKPRPP